MKLRSLALATAMLTMGFALAPTATAAHENTPEMDCAEPLGPVCEAYDEARRTPHAVDADGCDDGEIGLVVEGYEHDDPGVVVHDTEVCLEEPDPSVEDCESDEVGLVVEDLEACVEEPNPEPHNCPDGTVGGGYEDIFWLCVPTEPGCYKIHPGSPWVCLAL